MNARTKTTLTASYIIIAAILFALLGPAPRLLFARLQQPSSSKREGMVVTFAPDGVTVATGGNDGKIMLWDTSSGQRQKTLSHQSGAAVTGLAFAPDGTTLVSSGRDSVVRIWDVPSGTERHRLQAHESPIRAVTISNNGQQIASVAQDTRVAVWDASSGKLKTMLVGHHNFATSVDFSRNTSLLASGDEDGVIIIWDTASEQVSQTLLGHAGNIVDLAFSPNGHVIASTSSDATLRIWDTKTGQQLQLFQLGSLSAQALAFSNNAKTVVVGGADGTIAQFDIAAGQNVRDLKHHTQSVTGLAFSPDGKTLASTDASNQLVLWDMDTGQLRREIQVPDEPVPPTPTVPSDAVPLPPAIAPELSAAPPDAPPSPILIVAPATGGFGRYYSEILRAEGLNAFDLAEIGTLSAASLAPYDVVVLSEMGLTPAQVTLFSDWVNAGGNLIVMRPDKQLAGLLGLSDAGGTIAEGYLRVNTALAPGNGIVDTPIQYHGIADRYTLQGATSVATLYTNATSATLYPAISLRSVGTQGGQAAAFSFDLAHSIVYTRQGNPAWVGQERDGIVPIRSDDLYFGAAALNPQPDWVNLNNVAIPQADEQQRLLANLILFMNNDRKPLPRFWYFPRGKKAVVVMTGDDHSNGGTIGRFNQYQTQSPTGCSVEDWECVRSTSYIYTDTPLSNAEASAYNAAGFEVALHVNTNCLDFTPASLAADFSNQLAQFKAKYTSLPAPVTNRTHCLVWSDWSSQPKVSLNNNIRFDTNYYYWPPSWLLNRPGYFTGSGIPMRYADSDGTLIDVYQAVTQNTDESGQTYPFTIDSLLDKALGPEGYYGAITVNAHTDTASSAVSEAIVHSALSHQVPIVAARQLLTWLDGRNTSSFTNFAWSGTTLSFTINQASGARNLRAMLPLHSSAGVLATLTYNGSPVSFNTEGIKGSEYALFAAESGLYVASYAPDTTAPSVSVTYPAAGTMGVAQTASISATFSEALDLTSVNTTTFELRDPANKLVAASVSYDAATRSLVVRPNLALVPATTYTARIRGGTLEPRVKDLAGNALAADVVWSFTTKILPSCPCSIWNAATIPTVASDTDRNGVELGVTFQSEADGVITGLRFYKGADNSGTHIGSLWTNSGTLLARATFSNETASGWQQVSFATPVVISANLTYIASYYAPNGGYAMNTGYFSQTETQNPPLRALRDGDSGRNGLYAYSAAPVFPTSSYNASNYWVDIIFTPSTVPSGPCSANPIVAENCLQGNPESEWQISGSGDTSIQGFASDISVNHGQTISFKIDTTASSYRIDIYRLGYYGGNGARKIATIPSSATVARNQPDCLTVAATGLIDCGNWSVSASWTTPATATSGVYIARLVRTDTGGASHIPFIIRDDASTSALLFQTSDTTWQAYNMYGGKSLYSGGPGTNPSRAYKVSYNRPFNTRSVDNGQDYLFNAEYPMIRWLEANGYDVSYFTGVDSDRNGGLIRQHKVFLSVGHDEYWSAQQRAQVEAARNSGTGLAFLSGNEIYWKTRWENSVDGSGSAYRTLVCYKETHAGAKIDPTAAWTGTWRDPRFSPPADGGRPENALSGQLFAVNDGATTAIRVPAEEGKLRFWRNTTMATLASGSTASLPNGTLGYEWDSDADNGFRPAGLIQLSSTTVENAPVLIDYGSTFAPRTATHHLTLYRHSSGALVFGTGTVQWTWGLDANHDRSGTPTDVRMQQATVNLFADMGVQPATLQTGLVAASPSTDTSAPDTTISSPAAGAVLPAGSAVTVRGSATDSGGQVAAVEVSVDGGSTWHPASGRATWSYSFTPASAGAFSIQSRAIDDSGNIDGTPAQVAVNQGTNACPCSLWSNATTPAMVNDPDTAATEIGVRFQADVDGSITAIRFYKGPLNTGTHTGSLWTNTGTLLARVTFSNETASGWQQAQLSAPVSIKANTTYVVSYHAPNGRYAQDVDYFMGAYANAPLRVPAETASAPNGVYAYSSTPTFPTQGYRAANNWIDVVFAPASGPVATATRTPTPTRTATISATATRTLTPTPMAQGDAIFADGFESGSFSAWSQRVDSENDLSVTRTGAISGTYSMAAVIDNTTNMYVRDTTPVGEARYRARFRFDPNTLLMPSGASHRIFAIRNNSAELARIDLRWTTSGGYQVITSVRSDSASYTFSSWYKISDAPQALEIDWKAASAAGANDGYLTLWINGGLRQTLASVDNDTQRVEEARLGPLSSVDSGTQGTELYDDFVSRRSSPIGP